MDRAERATGLGRADRGEGIIDFGNAALLIASVLGLVALVKALMDPASRIAVAIVVLASFLATFVLSGTVWAHEQVIGGQALDKLGTDDKIVVAFFLAGAASGLWEGLRAVKNIGETVTK